MAQTIIMPKTGMAMEEGTVVRWLKKVGDAVSKGEAIAVIETDKVTMDLESDYEGTLLAIVHGDGTVVKATDTIAWIGAPGEKIPACSGTGRIAPVIHGRAGAAAAACWPLPCQPRRESARDSSSARFAAEPRHRPVFRRGVRPRAARCACGTSRRRS